MLPPSRLYRYVGPPELKARLKRGAHCIIVSDISDVVYWTTDFLPMGQTQGVVTATFVIDPSRQLWIADRHSEHVACADGGDVLAAGEMVFERARETVVALEITNQSTGYCPEPDCWGAVSAVLSELRIVHPFEFTKAFEFRRCTSCRATNLIKDEVFECVICNAPLNRTWNFDLQL